MERKSIERDFAIKLRREGLSYSEIQGQVRVARSTLSLWLRSIGLSKKQSQRLSDKKIVSALRGAQKRKEIRIKSSNEIKTKSAGDVGALTSRELWLIGIALYWAEGAKQHENNVSQGVNFTNSDPNLLKLFLVWLEKCCNVTKNDLVFELYIHEDVGNIGANDAVNWWKEKLSIQQIFSIPIYFKKHKLSTNRHIRNYHGQFRIKVRRSTNLNRKVSGWIKGIYCGIV